VDRYSTGRFFPWLTKHCVIQAHGREEAQHSLAAALRQVTASGICVRVGWVIQYREASYPGADKNPDPAAEWP